MGRRANAGNAEQIVKEYKSLKQPKAKPSLKDKKKLKKKASESISYNVVSKDSKQGSSQTVMDSGKNLPCRKSDRQLKFRVLDRGIKENTILCVVRKSQIKRAMMTSLINRLVGLPKMQEMVPSDLLG